MATKQEGYQPVPLPNDDYLSRGYGSAGGSDPNDLATTLGHPIDSSPLGQSMQRNLSSLGRHDDLDDDRGSTVQHVEGAGLHRTASGASMLGHGGTGGVGKSNTLKKKISVGGGLSRKSSLKRSNSRRSIHAGSIKGVTVADDVVGHEENSVFYTPVPTAGTPTELLVNRFQGAYSPSPTWRESWCLQDIYSLAQTTQRPNYILPRGAGLLRTAVQNPPEGFDCYKQHEYANSIPHGRWNQRCQPHPSRTPQAGR